MKTITLTKFKQTLDSLVEIDGLTPLQYCMALHKTDIKVKMQGQVCFSCEYSAGCTIESCDH